MEKEKALEDDINECIKRLSRAESLIISLGSEKVRWKDLI